MLWSASKSRPIAPSMTWASRLEFARCCNVVTTAIETSASRHAAPITHVDGLLIVDVAAGRMHGASTERLLAMSV
jgi:hypothetical protein